MSQRAFAHDFSFDPTYGYDLDRLLQVGAPAEPVDFASFWQQTYHEARQTPLQIETRPIRSWRPDLEVFEIEYTSRQGARIGGWLTRPRGSRPRRGVVVGHGYGGRDAPDFDLPGPPATAIFPCLRGQSRSATPAIPELAAGHVLSGIETRETYVHRGCAADLWCAASALIEIAPEAADNIHYMGGSFGGGIGAMALAWDSRFKLGFLSVPSFGNHPLRVTLPCTGSGESVRHYYKDRPEVLDVLAYFDSAVHAGRIGIPVLCECALFDPAVPPPGQFAVYNALAGPKELAVRQAGHFSYPAEADDNRRLREALEGWFSPSASSYEA